MLEVVNLACSRGEHQLFSGLSFTVKPGELLRVEGANGRGKTTLLRALCGIMMPVSGSVKWQGKDISELAEAYCRDLLYLGHLNAIKDELNALENMQISCSLAGMPANDAELVAAIRRIGLKGRETFPVKSLSQGQRRRVALSRLLLSNARLWILDEPLAALDTGAVRLIQDIIHEHLVKGGMVIYTTHQSLNVEGVDARSLVLT